MDIRDNYNFTTFSLDKTASFNRIAGITGAVRKIVTRGSKQVKDGIEAGVKTAQAGADSVINLPGTLKTIQEANQHSKLGNRLNMLGLAAVPIGLAPLVVKDASTKSAEAMRVEDKLREAKGLPPLANNVQAKALAAADNAAGAAGSVNGATDVANAPVPSTLSRKTKDGIVRVTNMTDPRYV